MEFLAKIADELGQALARRAVNGAPGHLRARVLAEAPGWAVSDVICTSGPDDRPVEERHPHVFIAIVVAGSFQYQSAAGRVLLTPGSLMLGNANQYFECPHEYGTGDRCLSFGYAPEYFRRLAADAGAGSAMARFRMLRLPPVRTLSPLVARAFAGLAAGAGVAWEEFSIHVAVQTMQLVHGLSPDSCRIPPGAQARVAAAVRNIESHPDVRLTLGDLAREAGLSPYHFLRTFERGTGVTPHQYILRVRLRNAALGLVADAANVLDIAFACGFSDVSNFNRAFRAEFGVSPHVYRARCGRTGRGSMGASFRAPTP